jgi:hypothetical protein
LHGGDQRGDRPDRQQRAIALKIDHDPGGVVQRLDRRRAALGAVVQLWRGHDGAAAELLHNPRNPGIVGGDHHRLGAHRRHRGAPGPFDQRTLDPAQGSQSHQWLAGKAVRSEPGGNDHQCVHCHFA